jgi:hypothetical protein
MKTLDEDDPDAYVFISKKGNALSIRRYDIILKRAAESASGGVLG